MKFKGTPMGSKRAFLQFKDTRLGLKDTEWETKRLGTGLSAANANRSAGVASAEELEMARFAVVQ